MATKNVQAMDCTQPATVKLERVRFFNRQLLTAEDMTTEREYFLQKLRRHNRFLHGWGVVCGLTVTAAPADREALRVQIGSGYALGPYGDEIFVGEAVYYDLAGCASGGATDPCEPSMVTPGAAGKATTVYLAIKYAECLSRPIQVASSGCGCDGEPCQYSRIRDSFQIQCLNQLPQPPAPTRVTLCDIVRGATAPCPPCPDDPWVVLARINLPARSTMRIDNSNIDNSARRILVSTVVLQDQVVRCCCGTVSQASSSSSSTVFVPLPAQPQVRVQSAPEAAVLNIGQQAIRVAGTTTTQITSTVLNSTTEAVENIVLTVDVSPALQGDQYTLSTGQGWSTTTLQKLMSAPFTLQAGKSQVFSFQIAPSSGVADVTVTSSASATTSTSGVSVQASQIQAVIGA